MKSYRKELWFNIPDRRGFKNITPDVELALRESGVWEGMVLVNRNHITASTIIWRNHAAILCVFRGDPTALYISRR